MSNKNALEKLKNRAVTLKPNTALEEAVARQKSGDQSGNTEHSKPVTNSSDEPENRKDQESQQPFEMPVKTSNSDVPRRFRTIMAKNEETAQGAKANVQTYDYLITEFTDLRNRANRKGIKTSVSTMMSNILHDYLLKNADDLEKAFGYRPFRG